MTARVTRKTEEQREMEEGRRNGEGWRKAEGGKEGRGWGDVVSGCCTEIGEGVHIDIDCYSDGDGGSTQRTRLRGLEMLHVHIVMEGGRRRGEKRDKVRNGRR
jgi:hypothetical protein